MFVAPSGKTYASRRRVPARQATYPRVSSQRPCESPSFPRVLSTSVTVRPHQSVSSGHSCASVEHGHAPLVEGESLGRSPPQHEVARSPTIPARSRRAPAPTRTDRRRWRWTTPGATRPRSGRRCRHGHVAVGRARRHPTGGSVRIPAAVASSSRANRPSVSRSISPAVRSPPSALRTVQRQRRPRLPSATDHLTSDPSAGRPRAARRSRPVSDRSSPTHDLVVRRLVHASAARGNLGGLGPARERPGFELSGERRRDPSADRARPARGTRRRPCHARGPGPAARRPRTAASRRRRPTATRGSHAVAARSVSMP